jgi:hypothetical protein
VVAKSVVVSFIGGRFPRGQFGSAPFMDSKLGAMIQGEIQFEHVDARFAEKAPLADPRSVAPQVAHDFGRHPRARAIRAWSDIQRRPG